MFKELDCDQTAFPASELSVSPGYNLNLEKDKHDHRSRLRSIFIVVTCASAMLVNVCSLAMFSYHSMTSWSLIIDLEYHLCLYFASDHRRGHPYSGRTAAVAGVFLFPEFCALSSLLSSVVPAHWRDNLGMHFLQTLQSTLPHNPVIGRVHLTAEPCLQDAGRDLQPRTGRHYKGL
jgi:hypothetical protein